MNRIERIIEEIQGKIDDYREKYPEEAKDDKWVIPRLEKQLKFYNWLLEDSDEPPVYELHDERPSPTVWGMGDVTYNIRLQLQKMNTRSRSKILVFDYDESASLQTSDKTQTPTPKARIDDRVYCVDCERGVGCPDWDPPDGWCTAGKPKVKTDG